jgi:hypothetical protein
VMFTCTLLRSHPESRRRWGETWTVVINSWVGCDNKMHARKEGPERGSVHARNEAMKDIFARCQEKTAVQVCTLTIMHCCLVTVISHAMIACVTIWCQLPILAVPVCTELTTTLMGVYFPQVKNTMTRMSLYLIPAPSQTGTHWIDSIDQLIKIKVQKICLIFIFFCHGDEKTPNFFSKTMVKSVKIFNILKEWLNFNRIIDGSILIVSIDTIGHALH